MAKSDIFSLVCINENYDVLSVQSFTEIEDAKAQMYREYSNEIKSAESEGFEPESSLNDRDCFVEYGETTYFWRIVKNIIL